jgi:hypothetical protein
MEQFILIIKVKYVKENNSAQPGAGADLAFGLGSRRIESSMASIVY